MKVLRATTIGLLIMAALCAPASAEEKKPPQGRLVIETADRMLNSSESKITTLSGNVMLRYTDYETEAETIIYADEAAVDENSKTATAKGNVTISSDDMKLEGDSLLYKFKEKYFEVTNPSGVTQDAKDPNKKMYFRGERALGTEKKIKIFYADFSSCGPQCPNEYHMRASNISVYPGIKVIARKTGIYLRHTRVLWLPVYVYSLKDDENYKPEFGYNKVEGFYMKNRYPYLNKESLKVGGQAAIGYIIFNYAQLIGNTYGVDRKYYSGRLGGNGSVAATYNQQKNTGYSNNTLNLNQAIATGALDGSFSFDRNSSYNTIRSGSRTNNNNFTSNFNFKQSNSRNVAVRYTLTANRSLSNSENTTFNLDRKVTFSKKFRMNYSYAMTQRQDGDDPANVESTFRTNTTYNLKHFGVTVLTEKSFDPDGDKYARDDYVGVSSTKMPEVSFALNNNLWQKRLPIMQSVSFVHGRYRTGRRNNFSMYRKNEMAANFRKNYKAGDKFTLDLSHNFTQRFYSSKDANYVNDFGANANYLINQLSSVYLNFKRRGDAGGAPFSGDAGGEQITLDGGYKLNKYSAPISNPSARKPTMELSVTTGYNYRMYLYSPLSIMYKKSVSAHSALSLTGRRDLNTHKWEDTISQLTLSRKNTSLIMNATWDTEKDMELKTMSYDTIHKRRNGWTVKLRGSYTEGANNDELLRSVIATKTRCCTEMEFYYDVVLKEFKFQYSILAYPGKKFGFSQGQQGFELNNDLMQFKSN